MFKSNGQDIKLCGCGCGKPVTNDKNTYLHGHFTKSFDKEIFKRK